MPVKPENRESFSKRMREHAFRRIAEGTMGGRERMRGKIWVNNGIKNERLFKDQEIPEAWNKGRLKFKHKKPRGIYISDGVVTKEHPLNLPIPEGWTPGRTPTVNIIKHWNNLKGKKRSVEVCNKIKAGKKKQFEGLERKDPRRCAAAIDWRKFVFERDNYTCQRCGKRGGNLHAHHIKGWSAFPELRFDLSNGKTVCKYPCHGEEHVDSGFMVGLFKQRGYKKHDRDSKI